jgi:Mrp family chromosome partitioning ATPase
LPDNDSEILFSSDLSIIKSLADKYHVVIIDNLPLNHNVNALKLMEISDLNLLTLGYAKHNEDQLSILMDRLGLSNINLTGFILNNVSKNDYYGKKYKY